MTTLINSVTTNFINSTPKSVIFGAVAVIAVVLLLALLIAKVLIDAYGGKASEYKIHTFAIVILTFLFVMGKVIFERIAQVLHLF